MNKIIITTITILVAITTHAQVLYSNGASLTLKTGGTMQVNGTAQFENGSSITNDGAITITGNIVNNQIMSTPNAGTLTFNGSAAQTLSGSSTYFAKDVIINNANGVILNAPLKVDGMFSFSNGIVTAATAANAVTFTSNATISGTNIAKDASHINGFVVKEGTGSFTYPVGDGTKYQAVIVNTTANATGLRVKYNATDAGTGAFTNGGTEAAALVSYNNNEYWEITPLSTATGTVTIFWDGYKDAFTNPAVSQRKVAHLVGGNWLNEGTTGTGTVAAGSVTSNAVSSWSRFTMGSSIAVLPLAWLSVTGNLNNQKRATINWRVQENNVFNYIIEKSHDGINFTSIITINSQGNGTNNYNYTDVVALQSVGFYRIKQINRFGLFSFSAIIKMVNQNNSTISIYPNPVKNLATISGATVGSKATLANISGTQLQQINITHATFTINMGAYPSGVYILKTNYEAAIKIIKN